MSRGILVAAIRLAVAMGKTWRRRLLPTPRTPWDRARSRRLEVADDALARLQELVADLEAP